jgi:hypothetical protein
VGELSARLLTEAIKGNRVRGAGSCSGFRAGDHSHDLPMKIDLFGRGPLDIQREKWSALLGCSKHRIRRIRKSSPNRKSLNNDAQLRPSPLEWLYLNPSEAIDNYETL